MYREFGSDETSNLTDGHAHRSEVAVFSGAGPTSQRILLSWTVLAIGQEGSDEASHRTVTTHIGGLSAGQPKGSTSLMFRDTSRP